MTFSAFREKVQEQTKVLLQQNFLYVTEVDKDVLWSLYLESFPEGTNPKYLERTEHDCNACKSFAKKFGAVVAIVQNQIVSVWDFPDLPHPYDIVAAKLSDYVRSCPIRDRFLSDEFSIGTEKNLVELPDGTLKTWTHLSAKLPTCFVAGRDVASRIAETRDAKNVFQRGLKELTIEAIEVTLDLISQNSLYRGQEFKPLLEAFLVHRQYYDSLSEREGDVYCWDMASRSPASVTKIRNSAIGTLLVDLSEGVDLDAAVRKFQHSVMAPDQYKRAKTSYSPRMVDAARAKLQELGLEHSLGRRFATIEDVNVQNILFANVDTMRRIQPDNVFDSLKAMVATPKTFHGLEEVSIDAFINEILPRVTEMEVLLENHHASNLVSLVAPLDSSAPSIFKWANGFSWAYSGNVADSMKERVKAAGGKVEGVLRFSIQWNESGRNQNDFDAHALEPTEHLIHFQRKGVRQPSSGMLDVDIINPGDEIAVENIIYDDLSLMPNGNYQFMVHTYSNRGGIDGFRAEIEFDGEIYSFNHSRSTHTNETVNVATVTKNGSKLSIVPQLENTSSRISKDLWGKKSNEFHPVMAMMLSPNYWDDQTATGNKHFLFMLDGCINDGFPNGFFNEFLRNDLMPHRKVFEALGAKMQVSSDNPKQLSGLGFSSTKRNSLTVKVSGASQRILKILF